MKQLLEETLDAIKKAQEGKLGYFDIYMNKEKIEAENQFLFFIKPEITANIVSIKIHDIIELIFYNI